MHVTRQVQNCFLARVLLQLTDASAGFVFESHQRRGSHHGILAAQTKLPADESKEHEQQLKLFKVGQLMFFEDETIWQRTRLL